MTTKEFLNQLEQHPNSSLIFNYGKPIAPGYHITEIMKVTYQSMDCGGQANHWQETIIQLQGPGSKDKAEFMNVTKFLSIYQRVSKSVAIHEDNELRIEYGDHESPAIHYHIGSIASQDNQINIRLESPGVTCKARNRTINKLPLDLPIMNTPTCCSPTEPCC